GRAGRPGRLQYDPFPGDMAWIGAPRHGLDHLLGDLRVRDRPQLPAAHAHRPVGGPCPSRAVRELHHLAVVSLAVPAVIGPALGGIAVAIGGPSFAYGAAAVLLITAWIALFRVGPHPHPHGNVPAANVREF